MVPSALGCQDTTLTWFLHSCCCLHSTAPQPPHCPCNAGAPPGPILGPPHFPALTEGILSSHDSPARASPNSTPPPAHLKLDVSKTEPHPQPCTSQSSHHSCSDQTVFHLLRKNALESFLTPFLLSHLGFHPPLVPASTHIQNPAT